MSNSLHQVWNYTKPIPNLCIMYTLVTIFVSSYGKRYFTLCSWKESVTTLQLLRVGNKVTRYCHRIPFYSASGGARHFLFSVIASQLKAGWKLCNCIKCHRINLRRDELKTESKEMYSASAHWSFSCQLAQANTQIRHKIAEDAGCFDQRRYFHPFSTRLSYCPGSGGGGGE